MANVEYTDGGIPKRELTLQYKPLGSLVGDEPETDEDTPSVAGGTEIKIFADTIKEIFQKEPTTVPIQRGQDGHFQGDKTLIVDTLKAKHKFEISGWVYSNRSGKHSLDDEVIKPDTDGQEAEITTSDKMAIDEFNKFVPLGDTGIKYGSEEITRYELGDGTSDNTTLERGFRNPIKALSTSADRFVVSGDVTDVLSSGDSIEVINSTGNDGAYTVDTVAATDSGTTEINVNETVSDSTADGQIRAKDYVINYSRGEVKFLDTGLLNTTTDETKILGQTINTTTVISDKLEIKYTFDASAKNVARLIRRMSQLGNPLVMRLDKDDISLNDNDDVIDSHDYLVIPKKVSIASKSEKPAEYKVELELRKGTIEQ